jgi:hypothetical protein
MIPRTLPIFVVDFDFPVAAISAQCIQVFKATVVGCIGPRYSRENMFQEEHLMPMKKKAKKKKH